MVVQALSGRSNGQMLVVKVVDPRHREGGTQLWGCRWSLDTGPTVGGQLRVHDHFQVEKIFFKLTPGENVKRINVHLQKIFQGPDGHTASMTTPAAVVVGKF